MTTSMLKQLRSRFDSYFAFTAKPCLILILFVLQGCVSSPNTSVNLSNVCEIFEANPKWYRAAKKSTEKWGGNIQLPMSIIYQESTFKRNAKPKRTKVLGFIPGKRLSDAYGYAQALRSTWGEYETAVGSRRKQRDNFADAFDFVQWYVNQSHLRNQVSKWDYDAQYLNYHEGQGGYSRGSHLQKPWLIKTAARVDARATRYGAQLAQCREQLDTMRTGWF